MMIRNCLFLILFIFPFLAQTEDKILTITHGYNQSKFKKIQHNTFNSPLKDDALAAIFEEGDIRSIGVSNPIIFSIPRISPKENLIQFLQKHKINSTYPRLHLGCGEAHLAGYINIDFPSSEHTVQNKSGADIHGDITQLLLPAQSIGEIRSHHVFEHFNRQKALALLTIWHHSLCNNGKLVIETPDFEQSARMIIDSRYIYAQKQIILRHIFGSHEAFWAMHYDGWYEEKFKHILSALEFKVISSKKNSYLLTHNITITAVKTTHLSKEDLRERAHQLLKEHMVNNACDEQKMWLVWCKEFDNLFLPYILEKK